MDEDQHCATCDCHATVCGTARRKVVAFLLNTAALPFFVVTVGVVTFSGTMKDRSFPMYCILISGVALTWIWILLGAIIPNTEIIKMVVVGCAALFLDLVFQSYDCFCFLFRCMYNVRRAANERHYSLEHVVADGPDPPPEMPPNDIPPPLPERQGSIVGLIQPAIVYDIPSFRHRSPGPSGMGSNPARVYEDAVPDPTSGATGARMKTGLTSGATGARMKTGPTSSATGARMKTCQTSDITGARMKTSHTSGATGARTKTGRTSGATGTRNKTENVDEDECQLNLSHINVPISLSSGLTGRPIRGSEEKESSRNPKLGSLSTDDTRLRNNPQTMSLGATSTITGPCAERSKSSYIPFVPDTQPQNLTNFSTVGSMSETNTTGASGRAIPSSRNLGVVTKTSPKSSNLDVTPKSSPSALHDVLKTSPKSSSLATNTKDDTVESSETIRSLLPDTKSSLFSTSFGTTVDETENVDASVCQLDLSHIDVPISSPPVVTDDSIRNTNETLSSRDIAQQNSRSQDTEQVRNNPLPKSYGGTRISGHQQSSSYITFAPDTEPQNSANLKFPDSLQIKRGGNIDNSTSESNASQINLPISSNVHSSQSTQDTNEDKEQLSEPKRAIRSQLASPSEPTRARISPQSASPSDNKLVKLSPVASPSYHKQEISCPRALPSDHRDSRVSSEVSVSDPTRLRTIPKILNFDSKAGSSTGSTGMRESGSGYISFIPDARQPNSRTVDTHPDSDELKVPHIETNIISEHHEANLFTSSFGKTLDLTENIDDSIMQLDASHILVPILPRTEESSELPEFKFTSQSSTSSSPYCRLSQPVPALDSPYLRMSPPDPAQDSPYLNMVPPAPAQDSGYLRMGPPVPATDSGYLRMSPPVPAPDSGYLRMSPPVPAPDSGYLRMSPPVTATDSSRLNIQFDRQDDNCSINNFSDEERHEISLLDEQISERDVCRVQSISEGQSNEDIPKTYAELSIPDQNNDWSENAYQVIYDGQSLSSASSGYNDRNGLEPLELRRRIRTTSEKCGVKTFAAVPVTDRSKTL